MRLPRVRFTVRRMTLIVAGIALALFVAREFQDGSPPRYVLEGIPERINRLRPGMTWEQTREILGLEKHWLRGGTSARFFRGIGFGRSMHRTYLVRPWRIVVVEARVGGGSPAPVSIFQSKAVISVSFDIDNESGRLWWEDKSSYRLVDASYSSDSRTIAEMSRAR